MQEIEEKKNLIDKVSIFFKENKLKIIILMSTILLIVASFFFFKFYNDKKNILISEKFIQASIYLSSKKKEESKKLLEEIIYAKNPFYSVLALNLILEKKLIKDTGKILLYFEKLEGISLNDEQKTLVDFKKALFLINGPDVSEGKKILRKIIESKSHFQSLAQDILTEY